jgi:hypothetical protein
MSLIVNLSISAVRRARLIRALGVFLNVKRLIMKHDELPERWVEKLKAYLREKYGTERYGLSAGDFSIRQHLKINFPDGSFVFFRQAFCLHDVNLNEVVVFTEHCGYHIFPLYDTQIEILESTWVEVETE